MEAGRAESASPDRLDYSIGEKFHDTAYATLLRGVRRGDGAPIVIKRLRSDYPSAIELARLHHEHAILRSLSLRGVVRTFGLVATDHGPGLLLEDIGDQSIRTIIQSGRPTLGRFLELAIEMASVVDSIHRQHILHKDIKPDHFFIDPRSGACKLIDFGIATRLSREAQPPVGGAAIEGTFAYISPEQTGRMNRAVDQRSDLYSLGVSLYELLTGVVPFSGVDPLALAHSHIARTPAAPHELVPGVPRAVSAIVMRLLAKTAEERYQSAAGLRADLEACAAQLASSGHIDPFPLGTRDVGDVLRIPQRLYGREAEAAALLASFERVRAGAAELLLIRGPSGAGKSAVVSELHKLLVLRGHFVAGKFDQLNRALPYAPISAACRDLVRSILAKPSAELATWAERIRAAVGPSGRVVIDLVPELELVIGEQPPLVELGPSESQNRFELVFRRFLQVFASDGHPLVLFLDDLQWADVASLRLLSALLGAPDRGHLLVLGAYRDGEVGPGHPLALFLDEMERAGAPPASITVGPLGERDVRRLFADALGAAEDRVAPLADLALAKTLGNPFFLTQFLTTLVDQHLLVFDAGSREWTWELGRIKEVMVTANVIDLLVDRIHRLRPDAQEVLKVASCIGHRFDLETVAAAVNRPVAAVGDALWDLLADGLLVPLDDHYQYVRDVDLSAGAGAPLNASYRFLHDRVRQAAYALIDPARRAEVHLQMGRLLLARADGSPSDELVFDVVNHLNLGASLIDDPAERRRLAALDLRAGRRARESAAHEAALALLRQCLALLGEGAWQSDNELAQAAHFTIAECEEALVRFDRAFAALDAIEREAAAVEQRAAARMFRSRLLTRSNRMEEACAVAVEAAAMLGLALPTAPDMLADANRAVFAEVEEALAARQGSLVDLAPMTDPHALAVAHALATLMPAAFMSNLPLYAQTTMQAVLLSLRHGNPPEAPEFYPGYGMAIRHLTGDRAAAYRVGRVGVTLAERPVHRRSASISHFLFGLFLSHAQAHVSESLEHLRRALRAGLENGDHMGVVACAGMLPTIRFVAGDDLDEIAAGIEESQALLTSFGDRMLGGPLSAIAGIVAALRGKGAPTGQGGPAGAPGSVEVPEVNPVMLAMSLTTSLVPLTLAGDSGAVLATCDAVGPIAPFIGDTILAVELVFHRALARARSLPGLPPAERAARLAELDADRASLADWASCAPANHAHRQAIVDAARAAATGATQEAIDGYDRAIALAREHGFGHHEALANELCGDLHVALGRAKVARVYLVDAYRGYRAWGARNKLAELAARHAEILADAAVSEPTVPITTMTMTSASPTGGLDVASAMRMMQAIAGELVLDKLIERLMSCLVENAAAQRGFLIVPHGGRLQVSAGLTVQPDVVRLGLAQDVESSGELAAAVVHYVARSREPVVLADAAKDDRFAGDPYVVRARPRSVLCVPMVHQGRLSGVMYLENNAATSVFDPGRVELIQFLAAQAAIAIENATLYRELEARVAERTAALAAANESLQTSLQDLGLAQRRLIDMSRQAGMADVATSILHNVGNVLSSVSVSTGLLRTAVEQSKAGAVGRVAALLAEHRDDLARFLGEDERGRHLPDYLARLGELLDGERGSLIEELRSLGDNIEHIEAIISRQQSNARMGAMVETVQITDLLDEAIRIGFPGADKAAAEGIRVERDYAPVPASSMDRHKVLQIALNLLSNARHAVVGASDRTIRVGCRAAGGRIVVTVEDHGIGIPAENLARIFNFGFTTKEKGHGFGLHSCANAATELGGTLTCRSEGPGRGATFTLELPLAPGEGQVAAGSK